METYLSFDDVLIAPQFSKIVSRKDVNLKQWLMNQDMSIPIISSNMDTVTEDRMARAMMENGGVGCLHRFMDIQKNVYIFKASIVNGKKPLVSVGLGNKELERFETLLSAGAKDFVLDVAHGASLEVVNQVKSMRLLHGNDFELMVGNFANSESLSDFLFHAGPSRVNAIKIGIGSGSMCTTRVVTGAGQPVLGSIINISSFIKAEKKNIKIIADGGMRTSGDIAKALAAGAHSVMLGGMLAGTEETPGGLIMSYSGEPTHYTDGANWFSLPDTGDHPTVTYSRVTKIYRGSASAESYDVQGKTAEHRTPEGESTEVVYKGSVAGILQQIEAGIRSSLSYVGASTLEEFRDKAKFVHITHGGNVESGPHGKL